MSDKNVRATVTKPFGWRGLGIEAHMDDVFEKGDKVVVILESEYERLKRLDERNRRLIDAIDSPE